MHYEAADAILAELVALLRPAVVENSLAPTDEQESKLYFHILIFTFD